jgi:GTP pyrophosphokinase
MRKLNFDTDDGIFKGKLTVMVKNTKTLDKLVENIKKVSGIDKVNRL